MIEYPKIDYDKVECEYATWFRFEFKDRVWESSKCLEIKIEEQFAADSVNQSANENSVEVIQSRHLPPAWLVETDFSVIFW